MKSKVVLTGLALIDTECVTERDAEKGNPVKMATGRWKR